MIDQQHLTDEAYVRWGNCYAASEALYHIMDGKAAGWKPMVIRLGVGSHGKMVCHWFLKHKSGLVIDPSVRQFEAPGWWYNKQPDYSKAVGCGFLTKEPSKRAVRLILALTWSTLRKRQTQPKAGRPATAGAHEGGRRWTSPSSRPPSKRPTTNSARSSTARRRPAISRASAR